MNRSLEKLLHVPSVPQEFMALDSNSGHWTADSLSALLHHLDRRGGPTLRGVSHARLVRAWSSMLGELSEPSSPLWSKSFTAAAGDFRLSAPAFEAALDVMIEGARGANVDHLVSRASELIGDDFDRPTAIVVLPSNIPAIALQTLLPALLAGRPLLLKMSSRESWLTSAIVEALHRHEPALVDAVAAVSWIGGQREIEDALFPGRQIIAYGSRATCHDVSSRDDVAEPVTLSASLSLEIVSSDAEVVETAAAIVRDITLFDQRGCLCPDSVFVEGDPHALAIEMLRQLKLAARQWPAVERSANEALVVHAFRTEARMRGLEVLALQSLDGTVVIDPTCDPRPSPGLRSVTIHRLEDLDSLLERLRPLRGQLQGCGLAGRRADELAPRLEQLGFSRIASCGELHHVAVGWTNGGVDPLELFAQRVP